MRPSALLSAQRVVILSLLCMIPLAMILLSLPICLSSKLPLIDLFFTATSLCTITGLMVIPFSAFSFTGQCILLCFMQIGGMGLITLSIYFMSFFMNLSIGTQVFSAKLLNINSWAGIKNFLFFIVKITFFIQCIGTLLLLCHTIQHYPTVHALFIAYFHAVSAFTSAGIIISPTLLLDSWCLVVLAILMISGEIGFIVWYEIIEYIRSIFTSKRIILSLHTKIVVHSTILISVSSFIMYCLLERCVSLEGFDFYRASLVCLFNSVAARGTGFFIGSVAHLSLPTLIIVMLLSFIGASPGSTGSGIKTTSLSLLFAFVRSTIYNHPATTLRGRTVPCLQINQVLSLIILSLAWIFVIFFALLMSESASARSILFEVISAFGNCGLSLGLTPHLTWFGKLCIALTMIAGRIGCLSIVLAVVSVKRLPECSYPIEKIMIS